MTNRPIIFSAPMINALLDGRKTQTRRILKQQPPEWCANDKPGFSAFALKGFVEFRGDYPGSGPASKFIKLRCARSDLLWVREAWKAPDNLDMYTPAEIARNVIDAGYHYHGPWCPHLTLADNMAHNWEEDHRPLFSNEPGRYRHGRFMPRWLSRLTLRVTDVRVERLNEISESDAIAEGLRGLSKDGTLVKYGIPDRDGEPGNDDFGWHWQDWHKDPRRAYRRLWNSINGPDAWEKNPWIVAITFDVIRKNIDEVE